MVVVEERGGEVRAIITGLVNDYCQCTIAPTTTTTTTTTTTIAAATTTYPSVAQVEVVAAAAETMMRKKLIVLIIVAATGIKEGKWGGGVGEYGSCMMHDRRICREGRCSSVE